jgi:glycosyltransferase involved in cell wall biosynthesis
MARPFVSVLIDTYNHERFIEEAIVSVLEQDFPASEREIVVVDDGSTDRTPDILRKFASEAQVLRKENGGQASAFNAGIPQCRGEIVAFLDGDDWWAEGKLARVVSVLSEDEECGIVGHGIANAFEDGTETRHTPRRERFRVDSVANARAFRLRKSFLGTSRMTLRKSVALQILPVPQNLIIEADEYLFTLAPVLSYLVFVPEVLTHYRQHGQNLYNAAEGSTSSLRRKQAVQTALAEALRLSLAKNDVPGEVVECICEIIEVEARQMRLMLEGGTPWETVRTESLIYEIMHGDAPRLHRMFRMATMIAAGALPPKWFYALRRQITRNGLYSRARKSLIPAPGITRIDV